MDTMSRHYQAGARRAWAPNRKDLGIEEERYRKAHGDTAWAEFVDGWMNALEED